MRSQCNWSMVATQLVAAMGQARSKRFVLLKPARLTFEQHALQGCSYLSGTIEQDVSRGTTYNVPHAEFEEPILSGSHAIHETFNIILSNPGNWITSTTFAIQDVTST